MKKISKYLNYEVEQFSKKYKQKKEEELKKLNDTYGPELVNLTNKRQDKINNETHRRLLIHDKNDLHAKKRKLQATLLKEQNAGLKTNIQEQINYTDTEIAGNADNQRKELEAFKKIVDEMQTLDKKTQQQKKNIDKIKSELKNKDLKKKTANLV